MKIVLGVFALAALGRAKVISGGYDNDYQEPAGDYGGSEYGESDYETKCTPYYETESQDRCERYTEKVCYTSQKESCGDVEDKTCRAIVSGRQYRKCFNVTDLLCSLKEEVRYDVVQAVFTVQKCHKATERVCDTVYEPQFTNKDDYQCIKVYNPHCRSEDKTVIDKTCRTTTRFDCSQPSHGYGGGRDAGYGNQGYGGSQDSGYGGGQDSGYGSQDSGYGGGGDSGYDKGYEEPKYVEPVCKKTYDTKCYNTPRTVSHEVCESREEKVCEKMQEKVPIPAERQVCHDEVKKVCELEQRSQPKQIKKYVYSKHCRSVPRRVCENADAKQLVPSCVPTARKTCTYSPVEKCEDVPKQHCYKIHRRVKKKKCETVKKAGYGPAPAADSYGTADSYSSGGDDYSK